MRNIGMASKEVYNVHYNAPKLFPMDPEPSVLYAASGGKRAIFLADINVIEDCFVSFKELLVLL